MDLKVSSLPTIARDLTDRNRTSPMAFTGNKFEFRAVGSKQSPSFPVCLLNAAVASSLMEVTAALEKARGSKPFVTDEDKMTVVKEFIKKSKAVRFEGNNYSDEWIKEAERRGLPNIKSCPVAFKMLLDPVHQKMLQTVGIFSQAELTSRYHILLEKYAKDLLIEGNTLRGMVQQQVLPAAFEYKKDLAESILSLKGVGVDGIAEKSSLDAMTLLTSSLYKNAALLVKIVESVSMEQDTEKMASMANKDLFPIMEEIRVDTDK